MIGRSRYQVLLWGTILIAAVAAVGFAAWHLPVHDPVFVIDETWTELMRAAREGDVVTVRRLLEEGCDPNARGGSLGLTPLIVSAANGHRDVVELLLGRGAAIEISDASGMTPLMNATLFEQTAVAQILLDHGADVNASIPASSMTPLMLARTPAMAKILLLAGADARVRTREGRTARDCAEDMGQSDLVELLRLAERQAIAPNTAAAPPDRIASKQAADTPNGSLQTVPDADPPHRWPSPGPGPEVR